MSDETGTVRIFDADPERVVSVTIGELKRLYSKSWLCGAHDDIDTDPIIYERTCHMKKTLRPMYGNQCSRCGGGVMESVSFCPVCGARVVDE